MVSRHINIIINPLIYSRSSHSRIFRCSTRHGFFHYCPGTYTFSSIWFVAVFPFLLGTASPLSWPCSQDVQWIVESHRLCPCWVWRLSLLVLSCLKLPFCLEKPFAFIILIISKFVHAFPSCSTDHCLLLPASAVNWTISNLQICCVS